MAEVFQSIQESKAHKEALKQATVGTEILSILIATTVDRRLMFNMLMQEFHMQVEQADFRGAGVERWQIQVLVVDEEGQPVLDANGKKQITVYQDQFKHPDKVELVFIEDDKTMSIGKKRQALLEKAKGKYIVFFDSDDYPRKGYVSDIMKAIAEEPDCVGFKIQMTTNGQNPETCIHSMRNTEWTHDGKAYLRNVTHFNPVRKELALQAGFPDLRFGEDKVYSDKVSKLCVREVFIDKFLFDYRYSNKEEHGKKYGFDK